MTFIVRQISNTNDGREIVRSTRLEATEIHIGRSADCALQLADLAVELDHAVLSIVSPNSVRIVATHGLGFEVDGRKTMSADIDPTAGAELRFGIHRLVIGQNDGVVTIAVTKIESSAGIAERAGLSKVYTLKQALPSRRLTAWTLALAVLVAFLAWPVYTFSASHGMKDRGPGYHGDMSWTVGALSQAHEGLSHNCQACHVSGFKAVQDNNCTACHTQIHNHADIHRQLVARAEPASLDRRFNAAFGKTTGRCVDCHAEHQGAGPMQTAQQQFCADCHAKIRSRLTNTALGDASDFGVNHPGLTALIATGPETTQLHRVSLEQPQVKYTGLKFSHAQHLSATNAVAQMGIRLGEERDKNGALKCADCHTPSADGTIFLPVSMEKNCQACHSLTFERVGGLMRTLRHGEVDQNIADIRSYALRGGAAPNVVPQGIARAIPGSYQQAKSIQVYGWSGGAAGAEQAVFGKNGVCADCHTVTPTGSSYQIAKVVQTDHVYSHGWFNHAAHQTTDCASCHRASASKSSNEVLIPGISTCRNCHVGETGAHVQHVSQPVKSSCVMCHDYHGSTRAPWIAHRRKPPDAS